MSVPSSAGLRAALLVAGASFTPATAHSQDPPHVVRIAEEGMDPEVRAVIDDLVQRAEADPQNPDSHIELGLAYEANTLFAPAAECYRNVLALVPDRKQWAFRLGVMQSALGDVDGALESLRAAAEAFKSTPVIQARLGDLLLSIGDVAGAEAAWEQAIVGEEKQPGQRPWPQSRVGLARVRYDQGRLEDAVKLLQEALALDPTYRHAHYLLGICYLDLGRQEEGELELKRGINAWPQFPPDPHQPLLDGYAVGYSRRMMDIEVQVNSGDAAGAEGALRAVLDQRPEDFLAWNLLARCLVMQNRGDEAIEALRKSDAANPESCNTKIELTIALMSQLVPAQEQLAQLQAELQAPGTSAERHAELTAQLQQLNGRMEALVAEIQNQALAGARLAPQFGRARFYNGLAQYMTAGNDPQRMQTALGEFEWAIKLGCVEPELYRYLGMAYAQSGRMKEMLQFAETFADKQPDNPSAWRFLAQAYMTRDQQEPDRSLRDKAWVAIQRAKELAPDDPVMAQYEAAFREEIERRNQAQAPAKKPGGGDQ